MHVVFLWSLRLFFSTEKDRKSSRHVIDPCACLKKFSSRVKWKWYHLSLPHAKLFSAVCCLLRVPGFEQLLQAFTAIISLVCCCFTFTFSDRCIIRRRPWAQFSSRLFIQLKVQLFFMRTVDREVCGLSSKNLDIVSEKTRLLWMTVFYDWAPQRKFLSPPLANKAQTWTVDKANGSRKMTVRFLSLINMGELCMMIEIYGTVFDWNLDLIGCVRSSKSNLCELQSSSAHGPP